MAKNHSTLNQDAIEQAKLIASEIVILALTAKRISIDSLQMAGEDESLASMLNCNQVITEKIGFLADLCSVKLGGSIGSGDAEDWMLPPAYHEAVNPRQETETV